MNYEVIAGRERATSPLTAEQYRALEKSSALWKLVDAGIVRLGQSRRARYGLEAGPYVGQAVVSPYVIRLREKVPGSLGAMLLFAADPEAKLIETDSFMDQSDTVLFALIDRFLSIVEEYLIWGRRKAYLAKRYRSALPTGKIRVVQTMRLWAKGRRDQAVYDRDDLSPAVFVNQIVGLALYVIDGITGRNRGNRDRRKRVRTASMFFEDVDWRSLDRLPHREVDRRFAEERSTFRDLAPLGSLARLFALHFGVSSLATGERAPFSWFVNLETLFEECLRKAVCLVAPEFGVEASDSSAARLYVFPKERSYRAHPDIVLWRARSPLVVADAKHKDLDRSPSNPDVYQLIAHAKAWGVTEAALAYPSSEVSEIDMGASAGGVRVRAFTADVRDLPGSARWILSAVIPANFQRGGTAV